MQRRAKGEIYSFIGINHLKVCTTHDWYMDSDTEKYEEGNYFAGEKAANACFSVIMEKHGDTIRDIAERRESNKNIYIRKCGILANKARVKSDAPDNILAELVETYKAYFKTYAKLNAEMQDITADIRDIIKHAPKTL